MKRLLAVVVFVPWSVVLPLAWHFWPGREAEPREAPPVSYVVRCCPARAGATWLCVYPDRVDEIVVLP